MILENVFNLLLTSITSPLFLQVCVCHLSERIVNSNIAVRANGGQTSQNSLATSPDPDNTSAQYIHSHGCKASVKTLCKERDGYKCVISGLLEDAEWRRLLEAKIPVSGPCVLHLKIIQSLLYYSLVLVHTPLNISLYTISDAIFLIILDALC